MGIFQKSPLFPTQKKKILQDSKKQAEEDAINRSIFKGILDIKPHSKLLTLKKEANFQVDYKFL